MATKTKQTIAFAVALIALLLVSGIASVSAAFLATPSRGGRGRIHEVPVIAEELVTECRGDINGDHLINFGDINPFRKGLFCVQNSMCILSDEAIARMDVNADCYVDEKDINPFVARIMAGLVNPNICILDP